MPNLLVYNFLCGGPSQIQSANLPWDQLDQFPNTEKFGSVCHERFIPETIMRG